MKAAIIDLGTNTFNLLFFEIDTHKKWKLLGKEQLSVKLGEGGINKQIILEPAFERGIQTLKFYKKMLEETGVEMIKAVATSAIRSAKNGNDFVREAKIQAKIDIEVIDGNREATLIYKGVQLAMPLKNEPSLIMDIGGGSVEFIIANNESIFWKHSFNIGAARLLEKFRPSDPITNAEIQNIQHYLDEQLLPLVQKSAEFSPQYLIGSSGSFDSFADLIFEHWGIEGLTGEQTSYLFNMNQYNEIHDLLLKSTQEERLKMPGLLSFRADMIVISSILTNYILKKLNLKSMYLSTYAMKEGLLAEMLT